MLTHLVEVGDDLVEEAETLHAHVVPVQLDVKVVEVGDGGEEHAHLGVGLVVQVLQGHPAEPVSPVSVAVTFDPEEEDAVTCWN